MRCSTSCALRSWTASPRLPEPQRQALGTAFGSRSGEPPDRFLVGLAVLGLFAEAAETTPLLCVLDDAQWIDTASAQTLTFVARRLAAERIAMVFAVRDAIDTGEDERCVRCSPGTHRPRSRRRRRRRPARLGDCGTVRRTCAQPNHRGGARKPARPPRTAARPGCGGARLRNRLGRPRRAHQSDRTGFRPTSGLASCRDTTADVDRGGRTDRRRDLAVAGGHAARHPRRCGRARTGGRPDRTRCAGSFPPSPDAVRDLSRRRRTGSAEGARGPRRGHDRRRRFGPSRLAPGGGRRRPG